MNGATIVRVLVLSDGEHIAAAKMFNSKVEATLGPYSNGDILERLLRLRENAQSDLGRPPQVAEFDVFASGRGEIGHNAPDAKLYAQTVPPEQWRDEGVGVDLSTLFRAARTPAPTTGAVS